MRGPLEGVKVVDFGAWVAGPASAGIMADWGAEVIKIEPRDGDPMRAIFTAGAGMDLGSCPPFEVDNRGKRSIAIDAKTEQGLEVIGKLIDQADVFVTNMRVPALRAMGLDWPDLHARNPRLVYGRITGYGETGPDALRPGYDVGAFWARSGIALALQQPDGEPPMPRAAMGDHTTAQALLCGILAALHARERTGQGDFVSTSLLRAGLYFQSYELSTLLRVPDVPERPATRWGFGNPLMTFYQARCGGWMQFLGLQGDRHWPGFCRAIGKPEWVDDARYQTMVSRREHIEDLIQALDAHFAQRTRAEWAEVLDREGVWWTPMLDPAEVLQDEQTAAAGAFVDMPLPDGSTARSISAPADFASGTAAPGAAPEIGQHTEEILLELGYDWDQIGALLEAGVLP